MSHDVADFSIIEMEHHIEYITRVIDLLTLQHKQLTEALIEKKKKNPPPPELTTFMLKPPGRLATLIKIPTPTFASFKERVKKEFDSALTNVPGKMFYKRRDINVELTAESFNDFLLTKNIDGILVVHFSGENTDKA